MEVFYKVKNHFSLLVYETIKRNGIYKLSKTILEMALKID